VLDETVYDEASHSYILDPNRNGHRDVRLWNQGSTQER
jgi:hypothetical protein